jgi:hypothetical protein
MSLYCGQFPVHCKQRLYIFFRPQAGCHLPNSPRPEIIKFFPAIESCVIDIPAGDGKIDNLFLQCIKKHSDRPFLAIGSYNHPKYSVRRPRKHPPPFTIVIVLFLPPLVPLAAEKYVHPPFLGMQHLVGLSSLHME